MVVHLKPSLVNAKVDLEELKKLEFCKKMIEEFAKEVNSEESAAIREAIHQPAKYGMDFNSDSYFFLQSGSDGTYFSYLFSLSDASAFADFLKNRLLSAEKGLHLNTENGMTLAATQGGAVAWNKEVAVLTSVSLQRDYGFGDYGDYDYEESDVWVEEEPADEEIIEEETEEMAEEETEIVMEEPTPEEEVVEESEWEETYEEEDYYGGESDEEYAQRKAQAIEDFTNSLFNIPSDSTILDNAKYRAMRSDRNDVSMWLDYGFVNQMGMRDLGYMDPSMKTFMNAYQSLSEDSNLSIAMNFNPGAIEVDYDIIMNPRWTRYLKASLDAKINRKFARYIKGDNLLGYFSVCYNMENMLREGKNLVMPLFESIPYVGPMAPEIIDISTSSSMRKGFTSFSKGILFLP